jgi:NAD(P)-dependent dehydrogenase (short-subunit alcohol dehydrogenase family)
VLVNNAGGGGHVPPHYPEATLAEWDFWLRLNLRTPMLATQVALRCGARAVVNIASSADDETGPHVSPEYAASKAGLIRFVEALDDPRVSCLIPGLLRTERASDEPGAIPLEDVADAVVGLIAHGGVLRI